MVKEPKKMNHDQENYPVAYLLRIFTVLFALISIWVILSVAKDNNVKDKCYKLSEKSDSAIYMTPAAGLPKPDADFRPWDEDAQIPMTHGDYLWVKIRFDNQAENDYRALMEIESRWVDEALLYTKVGNTDYEQLRTGRVVSFDEKALSSHLPVFPIEVLSNSEKVYLLRIESVAGLSFDTFRLWEDEFAFWAYSNKEQYLFSIYSGVLCALAAFLFVAFYVIRKKDVLYYVGYVLATGYCLLIIFNMQHRIPLLNQLNEATLARVYFPAQSLAIVFFVFFACKFLQIKEVLPKMDRWLRYGAVVLLGISALICVFGWDIKAEVVLYTGLPLVGISLLIALYRLTQGYRLAIYFVLAYLVVLVTGSGAVWAIVAGPGGPSGAQLNQLLLGFTVEVIILAIALGDRFLKLRHEQEEAQEQALREEENKVGLQKRYQSELKATVLKRNEELKEINAQKDRLFAIISHDLRTPINNMTALTNMMLQNPHAFSADSLVGYADEIRSTGKQLLTLLDNLLQWAQVQTNELILNTQTYNLSEMLASGLEVYRSYAQNKKVHFDVNIDPEIHVLTDSQITNTVIRNLLSNAIKYTPEGGDITLSAEDEGNFVCIKVSDTGIGLTEEAVDKIRSKESFESDSKLENTLSAGFGLALCQKLLVLQDVELNICSKKGVGSTFSFQLLKAE